MTKPKQMENMRDFKRGLKRAARITGELVAFGCNAGAASVLWPDYARLSLADSLLDLLSSGIRMRVRTIGRHVRDIKAEDAAAKAGLPGGVSA